MKFNIKMVNEDEEVLNVLKSKPNFHYEEKDCYYIELGYIEINTLEELLKLKDEIHEEFIISVPRDSYISDEACKNLPKEYNILIYNGYIE